MGSHVFDCIHGGVNPRRRHILQQDARAVKSRDLPAYLTGCLLRTSSLEDGRFDAGHILKVAEGSDHLEEARLVR